MYAWHGNVSSLRLPLSCVPMLSAPAEDHLQLGAGLPEFVSEIVKLLYVYTRATTISAHYVHRFHTFSCCLRLKRITYSWVQGYLNAGKKVQLVVEFIDSSANLA